MELRGEAAWEDNHALRQLVREQNVARVRAARPAPNAGLRAQTKKLVLKKQRRT